MSATPAPLPRRHRVARLAVWLLLGGLALLLVLGLLAVLMLPTLASGAGARAASRWLERPVSIERLSLDPWRLAIHLESLRLGPWHGSAGDADALRIAQADLRLAPRSLRGGGIEILALHISHPQLRLGRDAQGRLSVQDLLDRFLGKPSTRPPTPLVLRDLVIHDGEIDWDDLRQGSHHRLSGLELELPFFSTRPADAAQPVTPRLYARLDDRLLVLYGSEQARAGERSVEAHFEVEDLRLPEYTDLLPPPAGLVLRDGRFDARMNLHLGLRAGALPTVRLDGRLALRDLDLRSSASAATPLLTLGALDLPVQAADPGQGSAALGVLAIRGFTLNLSRDAQGGMEVVDVLRRFQAAAAPAHPAADHGAPRARAGTPSTWQLSAEGIDFQGGQLSWRDDSRSTPVRLAIRDASLGVGPLRWPARAPVGFALTLRGDGRQAVYLGGQLFPEGPRISAEARLEQLDADRFSPYFADRLPVLVEAAPFSSRAHLEAGLADSSPFARIEGLEFDLPSLRIRARSSGALIAAVENIGIHGLAADSRAAAATVDRLGWSALHAPLAGGAEASSGPLSLSALAADAKAGHYQLGSLQAEALSLPGQLSAQVLTGAGLDIDLPARHYRLHSFAAAGLAGAGGQGAAAIQVSDADADLAAGRYLASLLNASGLAAPGSNRIEGVSLRDADIDLPGRHVLLAALSAQGLDLGGRLQLPLLEAGGADIDAGKRRAHLAQLRLGGARLKLLRGPDGRLDSGSLAQALRGIPGAAQAPGPAPTGGPAQTREPAQTGGLAQTGGPAQVAAAAPAAGPAGDWHARLLALDIDDCAGSFEDRSRAQPVELRWSALHLHLSDVGTRASRLSGVEASALLEPDTHLALRGQLALDPLQGSLQVQLQGMPLRPWLAWLPETLQPPLSVASGTLGLEGSLQLGGRLSAPTGLWEGQASLNQVRLLSGTGETPLLAWDTLTLDGMHLNSTPMDAAIARILIGGLRADLRLLPDGSFNLGQALERPAAAPSASQAPAVSAAQPARTSAPAAGTGSKALLPFPLAIARIDVQDGQVDFSDRFVQPPYAAHVSHLDGSLRGLSSESAQPGELALSGQLDGGASVRVSGTVQPLRKPLALDLQAAARDFELRPLSSYSERFTGFPILRGKLNFDVGYHLHDGRIQASNQLTLDQLTLGPRQDRPGLRQLPVDLAVSLLQDSQGVIQVDLPIEGTLQDPKFNLGGIVEQIVTRAVERAVTAPFRWLGRLFGGEHAEALGWIGFAPGSDSLDATALDKLQHLAAALRARGSLRLDIAGRLDPEADAAALREHVFQGKLKVQKIRRLIAAGQPVGRPEEIRWGEEELPLLLAAAWQQEHPGQPTPDPARMAAELHASVRSDAGALADLAASRAQAAQNWLTGPGGIDPARVFLLGADGEASDQPAPAAAPAARVDFQVR